LNSEAFAKEIFAISLLEKVIESGNKAIFYCERILSLNDNPKI